MFYILIINMNKVAKFLIANINDELTDEYLFYYETRYKLTAIMDYVSDPNNEIIEDLNHKYPIIITKNEIQNNTLLGGIYRRLGINYSEIYLIKRTKSNVFYTIKNKKIFELSFSEIAISKFNNLNIRHFEYIRNPNLKQPDIPAAI